MEKKFPSQSHKQSPLSSHDIEYWKFQERNHRWLPLTVCSNYIYVINEERRFKKPLQVVQEVQSFILPCDRTKEPEWLCLNSAEVSSWKFYNHPYC